MPRMLDEALHVSLLAVMLCTHPSATAASDKQNQGECVRLPTAGMTISRANQHIVVCPGDYTVSLPSNSSAAISVDASNVTLFMENVRLEPSDARKFEGWGVRAQSVDGLKLLGGHIAGFRAAILIERGTGHSVSSAVLSHNRLRGVTGTPGDFLSVWPEFDGQLAVDSIGDGVVLINVSDSAVRNCSMTHQQNGIGCFGCTNVQIVGNNCSNNEGWGIHMRRSSSNLVAHNAADHCHPTRSEYCRTAQNNGCDSASLLLIKDSNDNLVINNSLTDGGDGIFSAAMGPADPSCPPSPTPCPDCCHWGTDRNVYERNDVRFARALCMESTFAFHNVFKSNRATNCSIAGAWLGYSVNVSLIDNDLSDSPTGVSDQSAVNITLIGNRILRNGIGVLTNTGTFPPTAVFSGLSSGYTLKGNIISDSTQYGADFLDTGNIELEGNIIANNSGGNLRFRVMETLVNPPPLQLNNNTIIAPGGGFNVENLQPTLVDARKNWWGTNDPAAVSQTLRGSEQMAVLPPNRVAVLEIEFSRPGDSSTRLTIKRPVNSRMDDAMDCGGKNSGNAQPLLALSTGCVLGLRFRDIYIPKNAKIHAMALRLPLSEAVAAGGALTIHVEAVADALAYQSPSVLPSHRQPGSTAVTWPIKASAVTNVTSPDLAPLLQELLTRQDGWQPGNSLSFLVRPPGTVVVARRATPLVTVVAFDSDGYSFDPATDLPTEWRHFRRHRFAQLSISYRTALASAMVFEVELADENDNADSSAADQNINFGYQGAHGTNPERGGFIFRNISLPVASDGFSLLDCRMILPTDGPYIPDLDLEVRVEASSPPNPYTDASLPAQRQLLPAVVKWPLHNATWHFTEWHASPNLAPLFTASIEHARTSWSSSSAGVGLQIVPGGGSSVPAASTTRRVWGFGRDPRRTPHDFINAGPTPFEPLLEHSPPVVSATSEHLTAAFQTVKPKRHLFGIGVVWGGWLGLNASAAEQWNQLSMQAIHAAGSTSTGLSFNWCDIEKTEGVYDWTVADAQVAHAAQHGLEGFAYSGNTPDWALDPAIIAKHGKGIGYRFPPMQKYATRFSAFFTALALRYRGKVQNYEFWNEQNGCGWTPDGCKGSEAVSSYVPWLKAWYTAMRAADPNAVLALGGLDCNGNSGDGCGNYLEAVYAQGGGSYFDAVPVHPYGTPLNWDALDKVRAVLVKHGDASKAVWINEYGWNTKDEGAKSRDLVTVLSALQNNSTYDYVELAQYLVLTDLPNAPKIGGHDYGLMDRDVDALTITPRLSYETFANFSKNAR